MEVEEFSANKDFTYTDDSHHSEISAANPFILDQSMSS